MTIWALIVALIIALVSILLLIIHREVLRLTTVEQVYIIPVGMILAITNRQVGLK